MSENFKSPKKCCAYTKSTHLCWKLPFPWREEYPGSPILCPITYLPPHSCELNPSTQKQFAETQTSCYSSRDNNLLLLLLQDWSYSQCSSLHGSRAAGVCESFTISPTAGTRWILWDNPTHNGEGLRMLPLWSWIAPNAVLPWSKALRRMTGSPEACKAQLLLTMQEKTSLEYFTSHHFLSLSLIYIRDYMLPFINCLLLSLPPVLSVTFTVYKSFLYFTVQLFHIWFYLWLDGLFRKFQTGHLLYKWINKQQ